MGVSSIDDMEPWTDMVLNPERLVPADENEPVNGPEITRVVELVGIMVLLLPSTNDVAEFGIADSGNDGPIEEIAGDVLGIVLTGAVLAAVSGELCIEPEIEATTEEDDCISLAEALLLMMTVTSVVVRSVICAVDSFVAKVAT